MHDSQIITHFVFTIKITKIVLAICYQLHDENSIFNRLSTSWNDSKWKDHQTNCELNAWIPWHADHICLNSNVLQTSTWVCMQKATVYHGDITVHREDSACKQRTQFDFPIYPGVRSVGAICS